MHVVFLKKDEMFSHLLASIMISAPASLYAFFTTGNMIFFNLLNKAVFLFQIMTSDVKLNHFSRLVKNGAYIPIAC